MAANEWIRCGVLVLYCAPIFAVTTLTGCTPNYRSFCKENVELSASLKQGEPIYRTVSIGTPAQPFDANLDTYGDLVVEISQGNTIMLRDLTGVVVESKASDVRNLDEVGYDTGWPKGSKRFRLGGRLFVTMNGDRILSVSANSVGLKPEENPPRFGRKAPDALFTMPFDHEQVVELFGKPDKLIDEWRR